MAENLYTIGNPPAGIYSGDINVGYAFYHVLLDVHARDIKKGLLYAIIGEAGLTPEEFEELL